MASPAPSSSTPLIVVVVAVLFAAGAALFIKDIGQLSTLVAIAAGAGLGCLYIFPPARAAGADAASDTVSRSVTDSRNEVINAMSILQQEIRLLQASASGATEKKALRDEISHLAIEVAALKQVLQSTRK